jgi:hypothetical protein
MNAMRGVMPVLENKAHFDPSPLGSILVDRLRPGVVIDYQTTELALIEGSVAATRISRT